MTPGPLITCVIVEDEPDGQLAIQNLLLNYPDLRLLGMAANAKQALALLRNQPSDLLFLDIKLPGITGLDLLGLLDQPLPMVVAITAYGEFAVQAFEHAVIDFVPKPIDSHRFDEAIQRVRHIRELRQLQTIYGIFSLQVDDGDQHMVVRDNYEQFLIPYCQIWYIESYGNYVKIYLTVSAPLNCVMARRTINSVEEELPSPLFVRIHRKFIVAKGQVKQVRNGTVAFANGLTLRVGQQYRNRVLDSFN